MANEKKKFIWIIGFILILPLSSAFEYPILFNDTFDYVVNNTNWTLSGGANGCNVNITAQTLDCMGSGFAIFNQQLINMSQSKSNWTVEFDLKYISGANVNDYLYVRNINSSVGGGTNYISINSQGTGDSISIISSSPMGHKGNIIYTNDTRNIRIVFLVNNTIQIYSNNTLNQTFPTSFTNNVTYFAITDNGNGIRMSLDNFLVYNDTNKLRKKLNISIFQEGTTNLLLQQVNLQFESLTQSFNYSTNSGSISFSPTTDIYIATISSTGYTTKTYNIDYDDHSNLNLNTYLLNSSIGTSTVFTIRDKITQSLLEGVKFETYDKIGTSYVKIDERYSDIVGTVTLSLNQDNEYRFNLSKIGYNTKIFDLQPSIASYDVELEPESETIVEPLSTGINYMFTPSNTILNNRTNYNFTFNLSSSLWGITGCTILLKNGSIVLLSNISTFNLSDCDIQIEYNTGDHQTIISQANVIFNSTYNISYQLEYSVRYIYKGNFTLKTVIDDVSNFSGAGFNNFSRMFIAFVLIFSITAWVTKDNVIQDPEVLIILVWILIVLFSYIGFFKLELSTIPDISGIGKAGLQKWIFAIFSSLAAFALIAYRRFIL